MSIRSISLRHVLPGLCAVAGLALAEPPEIPEPLQAWEDWATWDVKHRDCPTPYYSAEEHICFWPAQLTMHAGADGGRWELGVTVYEETWVPLPGNAEMWPLQVRTNETELVVVERAGIPSVRLPAGDHQLTGQFAWDKMPQRILIPKAIGLLSLHLNEGKPVPMPNWDTAGNLWLKRQRAEASDKDQMAVQVYRLLEDGIPMWLRTELELSVSGKSREEELGWVLPAGWKLAMVESPIPVAVDEDGRLKTQVRAGKWVVQLHAFRTTDPGELAYAETATPVIDRELVAFQARPSFRIAELEGLRAVDVTQTTFPEKWRSHPVYEWSTASSFRLVKKCEGWVSSAPRA